MSRDTFVLLSLRGLSLEKEIFLILFRASFPFPLSSELHQELLSPSALSFCLGTLLQNLLGFTDYQCYQDSVLLKLFLFFLHFRCAMTSSVGFRVSPGTLCWLGLSKIGCKESMTDWLTFVSRLCVARDTAEQPHLMGSHLPKYTLQPQLGSKSGFLSL